MRRFNTAIPYTAQELSLFCSQIALLLRAGVFLPDGIASLAEDSADAVLCTIAGEVEGGGSLAAALGRTEKFPRYLVNMVDIGEKSGKLEQVMDSLSRYYEREDTLRKQVKVAVFYPLLHACMMIAVIAVLCVVVLPVFAQVFQGLGGAAGGSAAAMLRFGQVAGYAALALTVLIAAAALIVFLMMRTQKGYDQLAAILGRFGPSRKLMEKIAAGRFSFVMSLLLGSGYPADAALKLAPQVIGNQMVNQKITGCSKAMEDGASFLAAVETTGLFAGVYSKILGVGMRTGAMDVVCAKIADIYEEEIDESLSRAITAVEPAMVAILCAIIGAILLSVMLPLMSIMTSIG